jgi:hypothetical protein
MAFFFRLIFAICLLFPSLWMLRLAQWICPEIAERPKAGSEADNIHWLQAAKDWEQRPQ